MLFDSLQSDLQYSHKVTTIWIFGWSPAPSVPLVVGYWGGATWGRVVWNGSILDYGVPIKVSGVIPGILRRWGVLRGKVGGGWGGGGSWRLYWLAQVSVLADGCTRMRMAAAVISRGIGWLFLWYVIRGEIGEDSPSCVGHIGLLIHLMSTMMIGFMRYFFLSFFISGYLLRRVYDTVRNVFLSWGPLWQTE